MSVTEAIAEILVAKIIISIVFLLITFIDTEIAKIKASFLAFKIADT